jgi:ribosomal protein S18 acetylase RimI-like enzyme
LEVGIGVTVGDVQIRTATPDDERQLLALIADHQDYHRALESDWPAGSEIASEYLRYLQDECAAFDGGIFVAENAGSLAGFLCVSNRRGAPDHPDRHAFVQDVFVAPEYRRRGIARRLMDAAEMFAASRGVREIRLAVLERNVDARGLYEALGFRGYARVLSKRMNGGD